MMAIGCVSTFAIAGDLYAQSGLWMIVLFAAVGFPSIAIWAWAGVSIRRWLTNQKRQRMFNLCMSVATAATLLMIIGH